MRRHETLFLLASAAVAAAAPPALKSWVDGRLRDGVEPALSRALGLPVSIGEAEADLVGGVVLRHVRVGNTFAAEAVSAGVGLTHLLAGTLTADEIEVVRPRLAARLDGGRLDLGIRRGRGGPSAGADSRPRRIRVSGGEVIVDLGDAGVVRAEGVELYPQEGGVRVVAGRSTVSVARGPWRVAATFPRAGLDVALPSLVVARAALDGGTIAVEAAGAPPLVVERALFVHGADTRVSGEIAGLGPASLRIEPGDGLTFTAAARALPLAPLAPALPAWLAPAGRAGGEVVGHVRGGDIDLELALRLDGVRLVDPLVSTAPLPLTLALDGSLALRPADRAARGRVEVRSGPLVVAVVADGALAADRSLARLTASAELARVGCAEALTGFPAPLRAPLDGLGLGGEIAGRAAVAWDAARPDATRLDVDVDADCGVDEVPAALGDLRGGVAHAFPDGTSRRLAPGQPHYTALRDMPAFLPAAFVAAEDARFFAHPGFDLEQMRRSLARDLAARRVERGGSTITQQLVKNLYLTRDRTLARKLAEAMLTFVVEARASKQQILELYLNVIELGDGVYGVEPGARRWFGKGVHELTLAEAALLAAVTPAPLTLERRLAATHRVDADVAERMRAILSGMRGAVGRDAVRRAIDEIPRLRLR
ncbi:MAG TPA: biosynthetic peptidoglycan transglycosylase [Haliangiales bacterium]|nr:biosynthetic peptidoglycan transglycosylase [Haliangiales bacterium]